MHWSRLPLVVAAVAVVSGVDLEWKAAALAAGRGAAALDTPSSAVKPSLTLVVGIAALASALLLPRLCLPGALLVVAGVAANVISLDVWGAVPDPLAVHVAGGILHFNLADVCVTGGGLLFLAAVTWTLGRIPDERFEHLLTW